MRTNCTNHIATTAPV